MLRKDQEGESQMDHRTDRGGQFKSCPYWPFQVTWLDNLNYKGGVRLKVINLDVKRLF